MYPLVKRMFEKYRKLRTRPLFLLAAGAKPPFLNAEGYILGDFQSDPPPKKNWGG
jgi:hypothetical protein